MDARPGRQIPVVEHRRRGAVLLGCCAQPAAARRNGAGATFVFIARRFSNWGWLRIDRLQPPSVADPQAACGATTDGAADPADGGADPPAPRPALPAMAPINAPRGALSRSRERPGCYDIAWWRPIAWRGRGITPRWVIIAHINHRLTPALRHGSSLLHQARERSEPFWTDLWRNGTPDIWRRRANGNRRCRPVHQRGAKGMPALRVIPLNQLLLISAVTAYNPAHDFSALADHRTPDREQYNAVSHRSARG
jgi:hypothetical protein